MRLEQRPAQGGQGIVRQPVAQHVRERAHDRPVFPRLAGRKRGPSGHLHAAFGIDVNPRFLGIGGSGQDHIGAPGAVLAVGADIDRERAGSDIDFIRPQKKDQVERPRRCHLVRAKGAATRNETHIEGPHPRCGHMQDAVSVPVAAAGVRGDWASEDLGSE